MRFIPLSIPGRFFLLPAITLIGISVSGCKYYNADRLREADEVVHTVEKRMKRVEDDANNIHHAKRGSDSEK